MDLEIKAVGLVVGNGGVPDSPYRTGMGGDCQRMCPYAKAQHTL
jgi:hypothetical protein